MKAKLQFVRAKLVKFAIEEAEGLKLSVNGSFEGDLRLMTSQIMKRISF